MTTDNDDNNENSSTKRHPKPSLRQILSYLKIAEGLTELLLKAPYCDLRGVEETKRIALKLTRYFEDVVSEIGIWESFVTLHKKLYGKPLPFYDVSDDYNTDEIHLEDIQFLLWDATLENWEAETMVNPENMALSLTAAVAFRYLQGLFEDTPINETLYDFFHEARFTSDFYEVRQVLKWLFFDCYLTSGRFKESVFDEQMDFWMDYCRGNVQVAQQAAEVAIAFHHKIGPLALKPQEWLAALLTVHGQKEKADAIAGIKAKDAEPYILENFNPKSITLRNVDDELITIARTKYFKLPNSLLRDSDGCVGCYACYQGEWFLNGMNMWVDSARRNMPKYKEETKFERNVDTNTDGMELDLDKQLYFFQTIEEFDRFRTERLKMPKDQKVRLPKNVKNIIYFIPKNRWKPLLHHSQLRRIYQASRQSDVRP